MLVGAALDNDAGGHTARPAQKESTLIEKLTTTVPDGRVVEVFVAGPAGGVPLILHHGTPSSGLLYRGWVDACAERGVRLVGYSRPGYGGSSRHPGRDVADCVGDVVAVGAVLASDRFYVAGHSGGGPHALACAALLGDRVLGAATIGAPAPWGAPGLDWLAGQGEENVEEFEAARAGGDTLRELLEAWRAEMLGESQLAEPASEDPVAALGSLVSDADRAAITPETSAFAARRRRHALGDGIWGWYDDDLTETKPWGFDLTQIRVPVTVWHGGQDRFVPVAHGRWLATTIPGARARLLDDEGHFSIVDLRFARVVDDLLGLA
jgi:pimeloyl-ACP methyl ester carboxylesterase